MLRFNDVRIAETKAALLAANGFDLIIELRHAQLSAAAQQLPQPSAVLHVLLRPARVRPRATEPIVRGQGRDCLTPQP